MVCSDLFYWFNFEVLGRKEISDETCRYLKTSSCNKNYWLYYNGEKKPGYFENKIENGCYWT